MAANCGTRLRDGDMFVDEDFAPPVMDHLNVPSEIEMARRRETGQVCDVGRRIVR